MENVFVGYQGIYFDFLFLHIYHVSMSIRFSAFRRTHEGNESPAALKREETREPYDILAPIGMQKQAENIVKKAGEIFKKESLQGVHIRVLPALVPRRVRDVGGFFNERNKAVSLSLSLSFQVVMHKALARREEFVKIMKPMALKLLQTEAAQKGDYYTLQEMLKKRLENLSEDFPVRGESFSEKQEEEIILNNEYDFISSIIDIYEEYLKAVIPSTASESQIESQFIPEFYEFATVMDHFLCQVTAEAVTHMFQNGEKIPPKINLMHLFGRVAGESDPEAYVQVNENHDVQSLQHELLHFLLHRAKSPELLKGEKGKLIKNEVIQKLRETSIEPLTDEEALALLKKRNEEKTFRLGLLASFSEGKTAFDYSMDEFHKESMRSIQEMSAYLTPEQLYFFVQSGLIIGLEEAALAFFHHKTENEYAVKIFPYMEEKLIVLPPSELVMELKEIAAKHEQPEDFVKQLILRVFTPERIHQLTESIIQRFFK